MTETVINQPEKHFPEWMQLKENIHFHDRAPIIKEGQIWWAAVGENVGVEINGKNEKFSRPVIIFKKLSRHGFMAIPLTTQFHDGPWYVNFEFQGKQQYAALAQARVLSASRLYGPRCCGELSEEDFKSVCKGFEQLYIHP